MGCFGDFWLLGPKQKRKEKNHQKAILFGGLNR